LNLFNLASAAAVGAALGVKNEDLASGLATARGAPGRLERVGTNSDYLVLVDYAHTPDALTRVLTAARNLKPKRLITIFGCGGDRDRAKRPLMAVAAGRLSGLTIVTNDNPRTEDPSSIIGDIEEGLRILDLTKVEPEGLKQAETPGVYTVVPDRRAAIELGCGVLESGDVLVVAGKGHEDYQILGREKVHFDDREEVSAALAREGKF
jgi:UDP-N-acetylmuramoyl-L-alanyl-D-glutamate--2,6-diaminopimelate ligase